MYFCGNFDQPGTFRTFVGSDTTTDRLARFSTQATTAAQGARIGALFTFNRKDVTSRVGISFLSEDHACENVEREIPRGTSMNKLRADTRAAWNSQIFSKVTTTETNTTKLNQLYSALYFMNLLPQNKTGENPIYQSEEPYWDDIFTFWDTVSQLITHNLSFLLTKQHRCTTALFHILSPKAHEEFIRSMVDLFRHGYYVSDARSSFYNGAVQGGSNSDNVFADAFVKGVRGKVNWSDAFGAMVKNAEEVPPNNNDSRDPTGSTREGRSALPDWLKFGFITPKFSRSVSRAVE